MPNRLAVGLVLVVTVLAGGPVPHAGGQGGSLEGQFLVAEPRLSDPNFLEAVIFVITHNERGAFGVVINRPVHAVPVRTVQELLGQTPVDGSGEVVMHLGGPVALDAITILHSNDYEGAATIAVTRDVSVTGSAQVIEDIARGHGPRQVLLTLGYAGWSSGQLETEVAGGLWAAIPCDPGLLFAKDKGPLWRLALQRRGITL